MVWKYYLEFADAIRANSVAAAGRHFVVVGEGPREDVVARAALCLKQVLGGGGAE